MLLFLASAKLKAYLNLFNIGHRTRAMAENKFIISELLCYMKCYSGTVPTMQLSAALSGFYTDVEIENAKKVLYDCIKKVDDNADIGRFEVRRGDNKRSANVNDILRMYAVADVNKLELPALLQRI